MTGRKMRQGFLVGLTSMILSMVIGSGAVAQSSLMATLDLRDPITDRPIVANNGEKVRLRVTLSEPATGASPRGLYMMAWARPVEADATSCARAAQNFRATRRTPTGAVDLNGILLVTLNHDASLSSVDPKLNLYSSNMIAAHVLDPATTKIAMDRRAMRAIAPDASGTLVAADLAGPGRAVVASLGVPVSDLHVSNTGRIWAGTSSGQLVSLDPAGTEIARLAFGSPPQIVPSQDPENPLFIVFDRTGTAVLMNGDTGQEVLRTNLGAPLISVAAIGDTGVIGLTEGADAAQISYVDSPDRVISVPLGAAFENVTSGPDGRVGVIWTRGDALVDLVDFGRGRVVQQLSLDGKGLADVTFTDNAAYLFSPEGGFVGALDLATVALGRAAVLRRVDLGAAMPIPDSDTQLLMPLFPSPQILAVSPESQTGWIIGETAAMVEMPPMDSIRLRGGIPRIVNAVDRSFHEVSPGVFETVWAFSAGEWELVLTTDIGDLSTCIRFPVQGEAERRHLTKVRLTPISPAPVAGRTGTVELSLSDSNGAHVNLSELTLLVPSMISGWSTQVTATAGPDGVLRADISFPHAGPYVLQPLDLPAPYALVSAALIIAEDGEKP